MRRTSSWRNSLPFSITDSGPSEVLPPHNLRSYSANAESVPTRCIVHSSKAWSTPSVILPSRPPGPSLAAAGPQSRQPRVASGHGSVLRNPGPGSGQCPDVCLTLARVSAANHPPSAMQRRLPRSPRDRPPARRRTTRSWCSWANMCRSPPRRNSRTAAGAGRVDRSQRCGLAGSSNPASQLGRS